MCVRVYFRVRVVFTRVCARVSDWPDTGRFKTIRLVNISVAGSMRSEILCYRRISTRDWKHHECRCNVGIAIGTHCICYSSCQFEPGHIMPTSQETLGPSFRQGRDFTIWPAFLRCWVPLMDH